MNREAALLGTPTWTTFAGELGAVDRMLIETGRMGVLERPDQLVVGQARPRVSVLRGARRRGDARDPGAMSRGGADDRHRRRPTA